MGTRKKKTTDSVPFSAEKLRYQIESHNFTQTSLAEELGFGANYLSKFVNGVRGALIPRRVTLLLETVGIHYEDYLPDPEPEPEHPMRIDPEDALPWDIEQFEEKLLSAPSTVVLSGETIEELCKAMHETIYSAVYEAMKKVWGTN